MDAIDTQLLNLIQKDFPLVPEPYKVLADKLNISEAEVLERMAQLKNNGLIRRIGAIFDYKALGYTATLCAMEVPVERLAETVDIVNEYKGVTHNYLRDHRFNLWFTLIAPTATEIAETLMEIKIKTGINSLLDLPAKKMFKINVNFKVS